MTKPKILLVRKMSPLEYYYKFNSTDPLLKAGHEGNNKSIQQITDLLKDNGADFDVVTRKELSEEFVSRYDAVISAGGDGTVIAVAAYNKDKLQINLRSEAHSIGALCQKDIPSAMKAFLNGDYKIENWVRQDVYLDGKLIGRASNETCIGEKLRFDKLASYDLTFLNNSGEMTSEHQSSSGLIIVTGTGSSAWPAAFKPFLKTSNYFEFRNLLLHSGTIEKGVSSNFLVKYYGHEGKFSLDTMEYNLPRNSVLEIKLSAHPLRVIIPNS